MDIHHQRGRSSHDYTVKDVEPTLPGINYDPDDIALINDIPVSIEVDNFGRVTKINTPGEVSSNHRYNHTQC